MHYRVVTPADPQAARIFNEVCAWLREQPDMRRDRERLAKFCCAPQPPVQLRGAPIPQSFSG